MLVISLLLLRGDFKQTLEEEFVDEALRLPYTLLVFWILDKHASGQIEQPHQDQVNIILRELSALLVDNERRNVF